MATCTQAIQKLGLLGRPARRTPQAPYVLDPPPTPLHTSAPSATSASMPAHPSLPGALRSSSPWGGPITPDGAAGAAAASAASAAAPSAPPLPFDMPGSTAASTRTGGTSSTAGGTAASTHVDTMYLCPITTEVMEDPVIAGDGYTYERTAIEQWFKKR